MLRLELSSHVGGEMPGVAAVFSAGLQFYVWLALPTLWLPADFYLCMEVICLEFNTSMLKRVLVKQGPVCPLKNESIIVCQTVLQTGKLMF